MHFWTLQKTALALGVAILSLATPSTGRAQGGFLQNLCGCCKAGRPTYAAYGQGAPQVCNYVPQTCYRAELVTVPVTTYRPVVSPDPCGGCAVTCLRPTTALVQQTRLVPYTTYRLTYSSPCCFSNLVQGRTAYAPVTSAACTTCGTTGAACGLPSAGSPGAVYGAPLSPATSVPTLNTAPYTVAPSTGGTFVPNASTPAVVVPSNPNVPGTYVPGNAPAGTYLPSVPSVPAAPNTNAPAGTTNERPTAVPQIQQRPILDPAKPEVRVNPMSVPRIIDPRNRSARAPQPQPWSYHAVSRSTPRATEFMSLATAMVPAVVAPARAVAPVVKADDGWRASSR